MTVTTSVRGAVKAELVKRLGESTDLTEVTITRGYPGDQLTRQAIWFERTPGDVSFPVIMSGRHLRNDLWTMKLIILSAPAGGTVDEAEDACESYMNAVLDVVVDDMQLEGIVDGLVMLDITRVDGPDSVLTTEGFLSSAEIDIQATARIN